MRIQVKKQFESNEFSYIGHVEFILDSFKEYIKITQKEISVIDSRLKENDLLNKKFGTEFDFDSLYGGSEQIYIEKNITQIYYESIFIAIYSYFEKTLKKLCTLANNNRSEINKNHLIDFNHKSINYCYKYLKENIKIKLDNVDKSWDMLISIKTLRNLIIHNPSKELKKIEKNVKAIIKLKKIKNLTKMENDKLFSFSIKKKELLEDFVSTLEYFFKNIYYDLIH